MTHYFVLDTSAILASESNAILEYAPDCVVLPITVIRELEAKRGNPELGYMARKALHFIEDLRIQNKARNFNGKLLFDPEDPDGGSLYIDTEECGIDNDDKILQVAVNKGEEFGFENVTLVSNDLPLRILAGTQGVSVASHTSGRPETTYTGFQELTVDPEVINALYQEGFLEGDLGPINSGLILKAGRQSGLAVQLENGVKLVKDNEVFGVKARSVEQKFAIELLSNPLIPIVSLSGKTGSGKTSLGILAGLEAVLEHKAYDKIVVFRPLYPVGGQDLGFLPGTAEEKLQPWAQAVRDVLDALVEPIVIEEIMSRKILDIQPLTYIRGRTLTRTWIVVDESQQLDYNVLLTVLSRLGEGSKIILCGDTSQIDHKGVNKNNGIALVEKRLLGDAMFSMIRFSKTERSRVADMVADRLNSGV